MAWTQWSHAQLGFASALFSASTEKPQDNPGHLPEECIVTDPETGEVAGYRQVHVILFNGWDSRKAGTSPWPAAGKQPATVWKISRPKPHPFEIKQYEVT